MEETKCICKYESYDKVHTEELYLNKDTYKEEYDNILKAFNNEERRRKKSVSTYPIDIRTFISIKLTNKNTTFCNFRKISLFTVQDRVGFYDLYVCTGCKRRYKRYGLIDYPQKDKCKPELVCQNCYKVYKTKKGIDEHIINIHK